MGNFLFDIFLGLVVLILARYVAPIWQIVKNALKWRQAAKCAKTFPREIAFLVVQGGAVFFAFEFKKKRVTRRREEEGARKKGRKEGRKEGRKKGRKKGGKEEEEPIKTKKEK